MIFLFWQIACFHPQVYSTSLPWGGLGQDNPSDLVGNFIGLGQAFPYLISQRS